MSTDHGLLTCGGASGSKAWPWYASSLSCAVQMKSNRQSALRVCDVLGPSQLLLSGPPTMMARLSCPATTTTRPYTDPNSSLYIMHWSQPTQDMQFKDLAGFRKVSLCSAGTCRYSSTSTVPVRVSVPFHFFHFFFFFVQNQPHR